MVNRVAVICGSGQSFWGDLQNVPRPAEADLIGVNWTGLFLHRVQHLVSIHQQVPAYVRLLRSTGAWCAEALAQAEPPETHSRLAFEGVDHVWPLSPQGRQGTSSLFAVWVALEQLGYTRVILAGVPLDATGRFFDPPHAAAWNHDTHPGDRSAWEAAAGDWFGDRVRSCSGWTAELLGTPELAHAEEVA
jgi:hypothetical protein